MQQHTCLHIYTYIYTYIHVCMITIYVCIYLYVYIYICIYTYICIHLYTRTSVYMCTYIHMYISAYTHIYMYRYTCLEANLADVVHSWLSMSLNHREYMGAYTTVPCHMPNCKRDFDSGLTFDMPTFAESSRAPPFGDGRPDLLLQARLLLQLLLPQASLLLHCPNSTWECR